MYVLSLNDEHKQLQRNCTSDHVIFVFKTDESLHCLHVKNSVGINFPKYQTSHPYESPFCQEIYLFNLILLTFEVDYALILDCRQCQSYNIVNI